ncbi:hypothetical protein NPF39_002909 [Salmonella enterica subsp. enterica serovar Uganda]|uniref:hypothetical protein n=1 Tax=Citrobacter koseri TaxID=545 RepID=UPI00127B30A4|nr:hypothetical protein [Citrobacter koseri]EAT8998397.1 hypothetical protein [Salmonella enterica]EBO2751056.1 hypothetical protein [Salmonella enterica subsp. enterica serovar Agona]ECY0846649.1 hypothetical protein [Salmonella enterica subsp. enterica]EDE1788949.1 hypothetical protein [Salmonella enterica subsp. enterica serovar Enteritidis]EEJ6011103.1 hypothetical protein [Salmonella enterica subsp. enterica serovar Meleagridis]EGC3413794.1 hypothetical protein [Salmonella enterica subsp
MNEWMTVQGITREMMFEHGLARFIISDATLWHCIQRDKNYLWDDGVMNFQERKKSGWIKEYKFFMPYLIWLRKKIDNNEY